MSHINDEQIGQIHRRTSDLIRRVIEGTISFKPTMDVLQEIIEGKHEPAPEMPKRQFKICETFYGNRCSIDGSFFADGDDICAHGHQLGQSYAVR